MEPLERRLEATEARLAAHRRGLRLLGVSWLATIALAAWRGTSGEAQGVQESLRVRSLMIVNDDGKAVCLLDSDDHGGRIAVRDSVNFRAVGVLRATDRGGYLWVSSKARPGKPVCVMDAGEHGGVVGVYDDRERGVASMSAAEHGGYLGVADRDGVRSVDIGCLNGNGGEVVVYNAEGDSVLGALADARGRGRLKVERGGRMDVRNGDGELALALGAPEGYGLLNLHHQDGALALAAAGSADGDSASLAIGRLAAGWASQLGYIRGDGGFLVLCDAAGQRSLSAGLEEGTRGICVHGEGGDVAARMAVDEGGDGAVEVIRRDAGTVRLGD